MAESSLSIAFTNLQQEVAGFLGYSRTSTDWTTTQAAWMDGILRSGLRQFYFPPPTDQTQSTYEWSFLKPTASITISESAQEVNLPDDFGAIDGEITVSGDNSYWPLRVWGEGKVRQAHTTSPNSSGRPIMTAIAPIKGTNTTEGQRFKMLVYPITDAEYTLEFRYSILGDFLSGAKPYAYGGAAHAETLLESCLAIAEQRLDDSMTVHTIKFRERLAASIGYDRRLKPQLLGYNGDRSDLAGRRWSRHIGDQIVTVNGVAYGD